MKITRTIQDQDINTIVYIHNDNKVELTRIYKSRIYKMIVYTPNEAITMTKLNRLCGMSNEDFELFAELQADIESD